MNIQGLFLQMDDFLKYTTVFFFSCKENTVHSSSLLLGFFCFFVLKTVACTAVLKRAKAIFLRLGPLRFSAEPNLSCSAIYRASHANVYTHCHAHELPGKHTYTVDVCAPIHNTYAHLMKPCRYSSLILEFNCYYKTSHTYTHCNIIHNTCAIFWGPVF